MNGVGEERGRKMSSDCLCKLDNSDDSFCWSFTLSGWADAFLREGKT